MRGETSFPLRPSEQEISLGCSDNHGAEAILKIYNFISHIYNKTYIKPTLTQNGNCLKFTHFDVYYLLTLSNIIFFIIP